MIPVVQLFARDVPRLAFPAGGGLPQPGWCPLLHPEDERPAPLPRLYWRRESEVVAVGDCGGVYVFLCRQCPGLPYAHRYDCH